MCNFPCIPVPPVTHPFRRKYRSRDIYLKLPFMFVPLSWGWLLDARRRLGRSLTRLGMRPSQQRLCFGVLAELGPVSPPAVDEPIGDLS